MKDYIAITFEKGTADNEVLIALLSASGFEGFEQDNDELKAFIPLSEFSREELKSIAVKCNSDYTEQIIKATNWNAEWEAGFEPVVVDDFVAVRADFHKGIDNVKHEIVITPKMSFGTGHHATTYLMLSAMRNIEFAGRRVMDFGTGTGILAILAAKLDAVEIIAIDNDDWSIENATENVERNNCTGVTLQLADNPGQDGKYDVILANINRNVLLDHMETLAKMLMPEGVLLLSGLLVEDENSITSSAAQYNLRLIRRAERNNWISLQLSY